MSCALCGHDESDHGYDGCLRGADRNGACSCTLVKRPPVRERISYRLVRRNDDKPHRCPGCHRVAEWRMGVVLRRRPVRWPFTLWCASCRVRWVHGRIGDIIGTKGDWQ